MQVTSTVFPVFPNDLAPLFFFITYNILLIVTMLTSSCRLFPKLVNLGCSLNLISVSCLPLCISEFCHVATCMTPIMQRKGWCFLRLMLWRAQSDL